MGAHLGYFRAFWANENGAVTADLLALAAVSIGVTLAAIGVISQGAAEFGETLGNDVAAITIDANTPSE